MIVIPRINFNPSEKGNQWIVDGDRFWLAVDRLSQSQGSFSIGFDFGTSTTKLTRLELPDWKEYRESLEKEELEQNKGTTQVNDEGISTPPVDSSEETSEEDGETTPVETVPAKNTKTLPVDDQPPEGDSENKKEGTAPDPVPVPNNKDMDIPPSIVKPVNADTFEEIVFPADWYMACVHPSGNKRYRLTLLNTDANARQYEDGTPADNFYFQTSEQFETPICLVKLREIHREESQKRLIALESKSIHQVAALIYTGKVNTLESSYLRWKINPSNLLADLDRNIPVYLRESEQIIGPLRHEKQDSANACVLRLSRETVQVFYAEASPLPIPNEGIVEIDSWCYLSETAHDELKKILDDGTPLNPERTSRILQNLQELNSSLKEIGQRLEEGIDKIATRQDSTKGVDTILEQLAQNQKELQQLAEKIKEDTAVYRSDLADVLKKLDDNQRRSIEVLELLSLKNSSESTDRSLLPIEPIDDFDKDPPNWADEDAEVKFLTRLQEAITMIGLWYLPRFSLTFIPA